MKNKPHDADTILCVSASDFFIFFLTREAREKIACVLSSAGALP